MAGDVEVFDLTGHTKAKRAYAWSHLDGKADERTRFVAVLEIPPVESAETAVSVQIVKNSKKAINQRIKSMNDEIEQQVITRFIEMRKELAKAEHDLDRKREDVSSFGYLATMQFPHFIDRVCESSSDKYVSAVSGEMENSPREIIQFILSWKKDADIPRIDVERRKGETSRQWLQRVEAKALKNP